MEPVVLDTPAVRLRPHRADDADGMVDQCSDTEAYRWTTVPSPYTRADAEEYLRKAAAGWRSGDVYAFALADPATDEFLGTLDLRADGAGAAELGFGLRPVARGRGLLPEALRHVAAWAFDPANLGLEVLHWHAFVGNWSSRRAVWKVGFQVEGKVRGFATHRGTRRDAWVGSLRRDDLREPRNPWLTATRLTGADIRLRPFRESDAAACVEACRDQSSRYWLPGLPDPYTEQHALAFIGEREEEHAKGAGVYWCAADGTDDRCLGSFGLMNLDQQAASPEVGYWVHPAARGRGVASAATRLVSTHALAPADSGGLGLRRIVLCAAVANRASRRVAEKAGFTEVGVEHCAERRRDGQYHDLVRYELFAGG